MAITIKKIIFVLLMLIVSGLIFQTANAGLLKAEKATEITNNTNNVAAPTGSDSGYSQASLEDIIGQIIRLVLSVFGSIFVVLMFVAGNDWMQAAGNQEKVKKSITLIRNLIIGLALTMLAYALSSGMGGLISSLVLKQ